MSLAAYNITNLLSSTQRPDRPATQRLSLLRGGWPSGAHMAELLARRLDSRLSGKTIRRGGVRDRQSAPPAPDVRNGYRRTAKGHDPAFTDLIARYAKRQAEVLAALAFLGR